MTSPSGCLLTSGWPSTGGWSGSRPAGLAAFRSGDLLAALISDVDATQDLFIRGIGPPLAAALVGAGAVTVCLLILAPAGGLLALGLLAAGVVAPPLAVAASRR